MKAGRGIGVNVRDIAGIISIELAMVRVGRVFLGSSPNFNSGTSRGCKCLSISHLGNHLASSRTRSSSWVEGENAVGEGVIHVE